MFWLSFLRGISHVKGTIVMGVISTCAVASADRLMQFICFDASSHNGRTSTPCRGHRSLISQPPVQFNGRETHGSSRLEDA